MIKKSMMALGLTAAMAFGTVQPAMAETVMIAQGNTAQIGDNRAMYEAFDKNSSYNGGKWNRGWSYTENKIVFPVSGPTEFKEAGNADVLYWTGHGGRGGNLNVEAPDNIVSSYTTFAAKDYTSAWSGNNLKVAIMASCYQLDGGSGSASVYAKAMQNSNVRVVAGYHEGAPSTPRDQRIAAEFMNQVNKSESVRNAWMLANQSNNASDRWAVLTYKSNSNQYYRMPGFNFKFYSAPTDKTVYRFYLSKTDPTGGEVVKTVNQIADVTQYPTELVSTGDEITLNLSSLGGARSALSNSQDPIVSLRDFKDDKTVAAGVQLKNAANELIDSATSENIQNAAAIESFDLMEDAFAEGTGEAVSGSERKIGETTIYHNTYNGIRMTDNNIIVNADADGIYSVINKWNTVEAPVNNESGTCVARLTVDDAKAAVRPSLQSGDDINSVELVYDLQGDVYRLSYEIKTVGTSIFTVDCETGAVTAKTK